jgi:phosphoglycerate kinase
LFQKLSIEDVDTRGKRVLVRADFNVPLDGERIVDDLRIVRTLPTIEHIIRHDGCVILMSHMGRPGGKVVENLRLTPVGKRLEELLGRKVKKLDDCIGAEVKTEVGNMNRGDVVLLENLRFHKEEEENNPIFARELAILGDLYVNDAFSASHRKHASTYGVPRLFPQAAAGLLLKQEVECLDGILKNPARPFVAILGGAKISTKIPLIRNLLDVVDMLIIGGGMAYTFLKALGRPVGKSIVENGMIQAAKDILIKGIANEVPILYPIDHIIVPAISEDAEIKVVHQDGILPDWIGVDIGPLTLSKFIDAVKDARTIFWNGPLGVTEVSKFATGTEVVARTLAESSATTVIGGGDSAAFVQKAGLFDKMTHVSTGGGASLEYLGGKELPALSILTDQVK